MEDRSKLMLADGTVLEHSSCGAAEESLWCWISGKTMAECFALFNDPDVTKEITVLYTTTGLRYKGYTDPLVIRKGSGMIGTPTIEVKMTWPEGGEHSIEEFEIPKE